MTATYSLNIYEILFPVIKNEAKTKELVQNIENVIDKKFDDKKDSIATKEDIFNIRKEIETTKTDLHRTIYVVGLIQFLAIVGSVLAIVNFMLK